MGGRGAYFQKGGFRSYEYQATGETMGGFKVIEHKSKPNAGLPTMSNSPNAVYILKSHGYYKSIGIYGSDRRLQKEIDLGHGHTNRFKSGKKEHLQRGIAHVHHIKGGRDNNVRYMTQKEINKYGRAILEMGGKYK
jgi:hypothetical protein